MILNIDLGNTRLKWQLEENARVGRVEYLAHTHIEETCKSWDSHLIKKVRLASVGDTKAHNFLIDFCKKHSLEVLEFKTSENFCGVKNAYGKNYKNLGIDRWLNLIASYNEFGAAFVVSAGSALTLDKINTEGEHIGGFIVPGFQLALKSLKNKANFLSRIDFEKITDFYGKNTNGCVSLGISKMLQGLLYSAYKEEELPFIITGGDANKLVENLDLPYKIVEDLLFRGMRMADVT